MQNIWNVEENIHSVLLNFTLILWFVDDKMGSQWHMLNNFLDILYFEYFINFPYHCPKPLLKIAWSYQYFCINKKN